MAHRRRHLLTLPRMPICTPPASSFSANADMSSARDHNDRPIPKESVAFRFVGELVRRCDLAVRRPSEQAGESCQQYGANRGRPHARRIPVEVLGARG
jgi:hypothetical protein